MYFHAPFIHLSGVTVSIFRFFSVKLFYRQKRMNIHFLPTLTTPACTVYDNSRPTTGIIRRLRMSLPGFSLTLQVINKQRKPAFRQMPEDRLAPSMQKPYASPE